MKTPLNLRPRTLSRNSERTHDLNWRFDLHCHVEGERAHTNGATCVPTTIAKYLDQQVRAAVDDLRVAGEVRRCVHHSEHSADAYHLIETSSGLTQGRKQLNANFPRVRIGLLKSHIMSNLALRSRTIGVEKPRSREEDYVSDPRAGI
jgi:hypothetical protein